MVSKIIGINSFLLLLIAGLTFACCSKNKEVFPIPEDPIVTTEDDTLILTPNESFFSPVGTLRAHLLDKTSGNEYNKNENYDYIYGWKVLTDTILFGVDIKNTGTLTINPEMSILAVQDGSKMYIYFGSEKKELTLKTTSGEDIYKLQSAVNFENITPGFYIVKLQLKSLANSGSGIGNLKGLHISGSAAKGSAFEMRRYRPFAVHCKWETTSSAPVNISVHELTVVNTTANCYQPITTPFGYTGSPWSLKTETFGGYNFSLWSYGANDPVPPFYQESHLIAVGPGLTFGSYGHEGTGVKPRGDHPYIGINTNKQVIAVRMVPGEMYDTYWSYYLDPTEGHWKLYGCGKKYNKNGTIEYLKTGAFVEVAGGASVERSGHEIRETQYAGWQRDTSGNWHAINRMVGTSNLNDLSFREWQVVGNKFSMRMGGWGVPGTVKETLTLSNPPPLPDYLKGAYLDELYAMPATFDHQVPIEITAQSALLSFNVTDLGTNASAEIFWDTEEGLTKEEKWSNKKTIEINAGENTLTLEGLSPATTYYYRIKVVNDQGITWSYDTQIITTI